MSGSIPHDVPLQLQKQRCSFGCTPFLFAMEQTEQYLFLTPTYNNRFVSAPKITPTAELALYECLCERLLHLQSTTTDIASTPC